MAFADTAAREYYVALGEGNAIFASHTFVRDNILVQINGELDEAIAAEYEAALNAAGE